MDIVNWIFPKICVGCGRTGQYICLTCQKKLGKPEAICPICSKPSLDGRTHTRCQTRDGMRRLSVGLSYRGMVQTLLKKVKYKNSWDIIPFLFQLCDFPQFFSCIVTSVPMFPQKERARGFNQAMIFAKLLAEKNRGCNLVLLERIRATQPMFGLTKKERQKNIQGAFRLKKQNEKVIRNQLIILVDDVWTTGATMRECARTLAESGAREIWGMTLAR